MQIHDNITNKKTNSVALSQSGNYADQVTAACQSSANFCE
jgi:hypothetical protein